MSAAADTEPQRTHVACRHRMAAHGHRRQPDDDRRCVADHARLSLDRRSANARSSGCCSIRRFRQKVVEDAIGANWVDDDGVRHRPPCAARAPAPAQGEKPLDALKRRVAELAATPLDPSAPALALPADRRPRQRAKCDGLAHPPLHRRRHRADLGDACRSPTAASRPAAAPARTRPTRPRRRQRLAHRCRDQARRRPGVEGHRHGRQRRRQEQGVPRRARPAACRLARGGARGPADRSATWPRSR